METAHRDYSTISPTAKSLLLLKGVTAIPYAKEAAQLMLAPLPYQMNTDSKDLSFWLRVVHFEDRYWSINQLLDELPAKNVLELSSGFSFRGLETVKQPGYHYIDTDLPEVIALKKEFVAALEKQPPAGVLEVLPLNALDEAQFMETVNRFPEDPLVIVNEGLLMYLDDTEKEKLCNIIRRVLQQRRGYWITADIYVKRDAATNEIKRDEQWKAFYAQHQIHEKMFDSFEAAEIFFRKMGFEIEKVAARDHARLTGLPHVVENATEEQLHKMRAAGRIRATWRLKPVE